MDLTDDATVSVNGAMTSSELTGVQPQIIDPVPRANDAGSSESSSLEGVEALEQVGWYTVVLLLLDVNNTLCLL